MFGDSFYFIVSNLHSILDSKLHAAECIRVCVLYLNAFSPLVPFNGQLNGEDWAKNKISLAMHK